MVTNEDAVRELTRIAKQNDGILKPEDVVSQAQDSTSPLHSWFEWDDTEAAHAFRIWQARVLIRRVSVYIETGNDSRTVMRPFVSLSSDRKQEGGGYRMTAHVLSDAAHRAEMIANALSELRRVQEKYKHLQELADIWDTIRRAEALTGPLLDIQPEA